jgi:glutaredoxin-like protein NrdH
MTIRPVTVYTNPQCVQCDMTKRELTKLEIPFDVVDLSTVPAKLAEFKEKGYLAAPIVVAGTEAWSGFKLERIRGLKHVKIAD